MFDEFDILNKELSNDFFKIECVIECSSMQNMISSFDDYTTESEGTSTIQNKFQALASRVKEIFQKIIENVKSAFNKIRETVSSKVREQKLNEIKNKLQAIKTAAEMDSDFAKELAEKLSGSEWYASKDLCYDFQSYYTLQPLLNYQQDVHLNQYKYRIYILKDLLLFCVLVLLP